MLNLAVILQASAMTSWTLHLLPCSMWRPESCKARHDMLSVTLQGENAEPQMDGS